MKRVVFILLALAGFCRAEAQHVDFDLDIDFDIYPEYYSHYDDDIYRYGFNINSYAAMDEDRFVTQVYREYGIRRAVIRRYLRLGFSPSDILFGAELYYRTGIRFETIMERYYDSREHNWADVSLYFGVPFGSPRFQLIINSFNRYYVDWGRYYRSHHPHGRPPMYHNNWSYFRPAPAPVYRPEHRPTRPGLQSRPEPTRPNQQGSRPGQQVRPEQPTRPTPPERPSPPTRPEQPTRPAPADGGNSYRRGSSSSSSTPARQQATPSQPSRPQERPNQQARPQEQTRPAPADNGNDSYRRGSSSSSSSRQQATPSRSAESSRSSAVERGSESRGSSAGAASRGSSPSRGSGASQSRNAAGGRR